MSGQNDASTRPAAADNVLRARTADALSSEDASVINCAA
jgi:hypothetical protein